LIRTLVVSPNWVGDTIMALPVLDALAASGRFVTVLAKPHLAPLLELSPSVGRVIERGGSDDETVEAVHRAACQEAVLLPSSFRAAWLAWRGAVPHRWGYRGNWRSLLLTAPVPRPTPQKRLQIEDYRELLDALGVAPPTTWVPRLEIDDRRRESAARRLERAQLTGDGPLVGFFPGAEFGPSKRWPWRRFAEAINRLRERRPDLRQAIIVGPNEVWLGVRIHEESGRLHPLVGPDLDLAELAAVLSSFDALVTNDSGPMHLAAAVGVPCIALFGPTDPERTAPAGPGHQVISRDRWCAPCFRRRCPLLHHRCLRDIGVDDVVERVEKVVAVE